VPALAVGEAPLDNLRSGATPCLRLEMEIDALKCSTIYADSQVTEDIPADNRSASPNGMNCRVQRSPRTISQLLLLMAVAHKPGNTRAPLKIKALCAEAHAMPHKHKTTTLRQHLLIHWQTPESLNELGGSCQPRTKTNPRRDDPIKVWYDYLCIHQSSWPCGVRRDADNRPFLPDLKASRVVAQLRRSWSLCER